MLQKIYLLQKTTKKRLPLFFGFSYRLIAPLIGFRRPLELFVPPHRFFHQHRTLRGGGGGSLKFWKTRFRDNG